MALNTGNRNDEYDEQQRVAGGDSNLKQVSGDITQEFKVEKHSPDA